MKKLAKYGLLGAMFVASQSMVFAGVQPTVQNNDGVEIVKLAEVSKGTENVQGMTVTMTAIDSIAAVELTEEQKAEMAKAQEEQLQKMCDVLSWNYEEVKDKEMSEIFASLTEDQMDQLVEAGVIETATLTTASEAAMLPEGATVQMMESAQGTLSVEIIELTEEQKAEMVKAEEERLQKVCEVLGWNYEEVKGKGMTIVFEKATENEINKLIEAGLIYQAMSVEVAKITDGESVTQLTGLVEAKEAKEVK